MIHPKLKAQRKVSGASAWLLDQDDGIQFRQVSKIVLSVDAPENSRSVCLSSLIKCSFNVTGSIDQHRYVCSILFVVLVGVV